MPIRIACPTCFHAGQVPETLAGKPVRCPKCRAKFRVPDRDGELTVMMEADDVPTPTTRPVPSSEARCPFCSEAIQATAQKCKHCGEWLPQADLAGSGRPPRDTFSPVLLEVVSEAPPPFSRQQTWQPPPFNPAASNRVAAGVCGILLGGWGVHKFVIGRTGEGAIMLGVWIGCFVLGLCVYIPWVVCMALWIIGFVEGIIYLSKSEEQFYREYVVGRKGWF